MYTFPGEILGGSVAALEFVNKAAKAVGRTFTFGLSWGCCACWRLKGWVTNWTFGPGLTGPVDMVMAVAGLTAAEVLSKLCCCCNWWWWPLAMTTLALRPPVAATGCCLQKSVSISSNRQNPSLLFYSNLLLLLLLLGRSQEWWNQCGYGRWYLTRFETF